MHFTFLGVILTRAGISSHVSHIILTHSWIRNKKFQTQKSRETRMIHYRHKQPNDECLSVSELKLVHEKPGRGRAGRGHR